MIKFRIFELERLHTTAKESYVLKTPKSCGNLIFDEHKSSQDAKNQIDTVLRGGFVSRHNEYVILEVYQGGKDD